MLKYDQVRESMSKKYVSPVQRKVSGSIHGTERKTEKQLRTTKPKVVEPVDDDPKPKLYRVDWTEAKDKKNNRYVTAIDKTIALKLFDKKYGNNLDIATLSINRVPGEWNIRWPVMWERIGHDIEDTHKEQIAASIEKQRQDNAQYKEWLKPWLEFWKTLAEGQADDYTMYLELRKVKYNDWLNGWLEMWNDIGETKWENRSMFDYLEID